MSCLYILSLYYYFMDFAKPRIKFAFISKYVPSTKTRNVLRNCFRKKILVSSRTSDWSEIFEISDSCKKPVVKNLDMILDNTFRYKEQIK